MRADNATAVSCRVMFDLEEAALGNQPKPTAKIRGKGDVTLVY